MKALNNTLIDTIQGQPTTHTPIWMMRQAGRYLPEYMKIREEVGSFMGMCTRPDIAAEITLQPLRRFPLDAVIIFSDILTIPDAMGLGLYFEENQGPLFENPVRSERDIERLERNTPFSMEKLSYVMEAIKETSKRLKGEVPLIGFCGSPFTLACYMIEGSGSKRFIRTKQMMYSRPDLLHRLLSVLSEALISYLVEQVRAGASVLQIFDTWGGTLPTPAFKTFSLAYTQKIMDGVKKILGDSAPPIICFTKDAPIAWYKLYRDSGASVIGVDWRHELSAVAEALPRMPLQGNLDPFLLLGHPEAIRERAVEILDQVPAGTPHIFNLGHGIDKETPVEHVALLVDEVHNHSRRMRQK
ncbi:MAG: uroporphyrinogen decarboxylase [Porphyromonas sp.]|nr:uroporphyrinogen decarboxylase [Porphyromonas sp.]